MGHACFRHFLSKTSFRSAARQPKSSRARHVSVHRATVWARTFPLNRTCAKHAKKYPTLWPAFASLAIFAVKNLG